MLFGILCVLAAIIIFIPNYGPTQESSEIFAPIHYIGYCWSNRTYFVFRNDELQKMRNVDASLCNKIILLGFLTLLLPDNGVIKIAHIQGIALMIIGLIFIIQFIGYCVQLKK